MGRLENFLVSIFRQPRWHEEDPTLTDDVKHWVDAKQKTTSKMMCWMVMLMMRVHK
jgi:hypothetical protein